MSTTLRGNGSYKKEFLFDLYSLFGFQSFKLEQVKRIPSYSQSVFSSLSYDGWLKKADKNNPCSWMISHQIENILNKTNEEMQDNIFFRGEAGFKLSNSTEGLGE
jgi:hypothetical protein